MKHDRLGNNIALGVVLAVLAIFPTEGHAIPSFARQTNLPCTSCHTVFPELNTFGRFFKLSGYTLVGTTQIKDSAGNVDVDLEKIAPVSLMVQAAYTHILKERPGTQNNTVSLPQQLSLLLGGEITSRIGGFIQVTYDDQGAAFAIDNIDLRYANQATLGSESVLYGVTLNNNPTVQDLWNSTPAWGFPYASSSVTASPLASTLLEGGLAQRVAGLEAYALLNSSLYGEFGAYRSAQQGGAHPPDSTSFGIITSLAPYWRFALQKQLDDQYVEIGTYGMAATMYPAGITGLTDKYLDAGFDLNYEKSLGTDRFILHGGIIHEKRTLDATFHSQRSLRQSLNLNSLRIVGNYYVHRQVGFSAGYFSTTGDEDTAFYAPAAFSGSATGSPDSKGIILEFDYLPWLNTKFSVQYVAYSMFNGSSKNYDGAGRNASDNNSISFSTWIAF
jgi:hypothetical protein